MPQSKNKIGLWICTSLVMGNMIGSGVFLLPASLAPYGGISLVGWLITATGSICLALVFSTLARMVPKAGGPYAYTRQGFGDFAGFLVAWGYWISILATNAAIAVALVSYLTLFWPALEQNNLLAAIVALACIWGLTWINALGVRQGGIIQLVTTVLKILPLFAIAIFGLFYFNPENFTPFNPSGSSSISAITATVSLILWAFLGLESATIPADNVINPRKIIPRATILGTVITAFIYILGTAAVMGVIAPSSLANSTAPYADAASNMWGNWASYAVGLGAIISCFGALNGWILLQGQIPLASAKDGLFPKSFSHISKNGTPIVGMVISSILVTLLMGLNYTKGLVELFTFIIKLATLTCLVPYIFSSMAELLIFIKDRDQFNKQKLFGSSALAVVAFLYSLWAVGGAGQETVYWGFLLLMAGTPVYVWIQWSSKRDKDTAEKGNQ